jgi:hypothetical protein
MTPEQKTMAIWGGGMGAVIIAGWIVLGGWRGPLLEETCAKAAGLGKQYVTLYPAEGMHIDEATKKWKTLMEHQKAALGDAEASMVPALPRGYRETDLSSGAAQVHTDLQFLKQKASRTQVRIPTTLPLEEGLDQSADTRLLQLAQLYLYRNAIDTVMDAGITSISGIRVNKGPSDPQNKYAVLLCEMELDATWEKASQVLLDFIQKQNTKGFGIRALELIHDKSGTEKLRLTVSLLTANNPAWGLRADSAPTQLPPGGKPPAGGTGGGGRFGARPTEGN